MNSVRFVAFKGKSFVSKVIRFVTRSKDYSHIAYLSKNNQLIECWPTKTNPFQHWMVSNFGNHKLGTEYEVWRLHTGEFSNKINNYFFSIVDSKTKYNWIGCLAFVVKFINSIRHGRLFCSEGCITPIVKFLDWNRVIPSHVSPQDFIELIQARGAKCIKREVT